jgi:hypothetical protein
MSDMFRSYRTSLRDTCNEKRLFMFTLKIISKRLTIILHVSLLSTNKICDIYCCHYLECCVSKLFVHVLRVKKCWVMFFGSFLKEISIVNSPIYLQWRRELRKFNQSLIQSESKEIRITHMKTKKHWNNLSHTTFAFRKDTIWKI